MNRRWPILHITCFGILLFIGLLILEFAMRATKPYVTRMEGEYAEHITHDAEFLVTFTDRGRRLRPGASVLVNNHNISGLDVPIYINSNGFRDDELANPKPEGEKRILVLGDSITWGDYLPAEQVYVERIEHYLNTSRDGVDYQVINAGVGDIGIREELMILEDLGLSVDPDIVVVAFYMNDARPPWGFPDELGSRGWLRRRSVLAESLYAALKLRQWIEAEGVDRFDWIRSINSLDWAESRDDFLQLAHLARFDWGAGWDESSWDVVAEELDRLKTHADAHQFKVMIVAFPVLYQVEAQYVEDRPQRTLATLAAFRGFAFVDLLPTLREIDDEELFYDWCHPYPHPNDVIGRRIADALEEAFFL